MRSLHTPGQLRARLLSRPSLRLRNECLIGFASYLYYSNSDTEVLLLALELGSVSDIAKVGAAGTRASTEDLGCDKPEDADSSSEAKAHDAEAADETSEESDSTENSLEEDSADHNLPDIA